MNRLNSLVRVGCSTFIRSNQINTTKTTVSSVVSTYSSGCYNQTRSYAKFTDKKFEAIKKRRDEEARTKKVEAEQKFIEASRLSIEDLEFNDALGNLRDKYNKYKVVANSQMTTLFRKTANGEELEQAILFYKSIRNDKPNYFTHEQIAHLYYAFDRNNMWDVWTNILLNTHTFQIFPSHNIIAKTCFQLMRMDEPEQGLSKVIELIDEFLIRYSEVAQPFALTIAEGLGRKGGVERIYPLLEHYANSPGFIVDKKAIKFILRAAVVKGETETARALEILQPYIQRANLKDGITRSVIVMSKILVNPEDPSLVTDYNSWDDKLKESFGTNVVRIAQESSDQQPLKLKFQQFFKSIQPIPQSFSSLLN